MRIVLGCSVSLFCGGYDFITSGSNTTLCQLVQSRALKSGRVQADCYYTESMTIDHSSFGLLKRY